MDFALWMGNWINVDLILSRLINKLIIKLKAKIDDCNEVDWNRMFAEK